MLETGSGSTFHSYGLDVCMWVLLLDVRCQSRHGRGQCKTHQGIILFLTSRNPNAVQSRKTYSITLLFDFFVHAKRIHFPLMYMVTAWGFWRSGSYRFW